LYGIEAITTNNGWAMAVAGVIIVFSGLVVLSTTIAQFHKLLNFWENKDSFYQHLANRRSKDGLTGTLAPGLKISHSLRESARQYRLITSRIGEPFSLPKLIYLAELSGLPRPHATINDLIQAGLIVPDGQGHFLWK
jgi:hypothetical protein